MREEQVNGIKGGIVVSKKVEEEQLTKEIENEKKEPITQKEALDGCVGCSAFGCLPFALGIALIIKVL